MGFYSCLVLLLLAVITSGKRFSVNALSMGYYGMRCPLAEIIVKNTVNDALQSDPTLAAGLLRMHFHDCFIEVIFTCNPNHV